MPRLPVIVRQKDEHSGNLNELKSIGLQKFHDFFKQRETSIAFDSHNAQEVPGAQARGVDLRVGSSFELARLLADALPLERREFSKLEKEKVLTAFEFGKEKYDLFELKEREKGLVALAIRQKRELDRENEEKKKRAITMNSGLQAVASSAGTVTQRQLATTTQTTLTKEQEEEERKRLKREKKAKKAEKREKKRVKRENPDAAGGGGDTKTGTTGTTGTSLGTKGTKTTGGPARTYDTKS